MFDKLIQAKSSTECRNYSLNSINSLIQCFANFSKNPIGTYDNTIFKLQINPLVTFPQPIQNIMVNFSEPSLCKTIDASSEFKFGESKNYELSLYIKPGMSSTILLESIILTMNE